MHIPPAFALNDGTSIGALIERHPLASLVVVDAGLAEATPVPMVFYPERGRQGTLGFHLARANPIATLLGEGGRDALAVFMGVESYISPDWYADPQLVPTWNYMSVQVRGVPVALDDQHLCVLLDDLSRVNEAQLPKTPWTSDKLNPEVYAKMRRAIVGFEMPISELQGKAKMSQNRAPDDRSGVTRALRGLASESGDPRHAVADWVESLNHG